MKKKDEIYSKFFEFKVFIEMNLEKKLNLREVIMEESVFLTPSNNYSPRRVLEGI